MTVSLPWEPQFTWRKIGYLSYGNSLSYRDVLTQNPQWKVTELPPVGAQLRISATSPNSGVLTQGSFLFTSPSGSPDDIFPFDTEQEYVAALNKYTLQGVVDRDTLNGVTSDSLAAVTGIQNG